MSSWPERQKLRQTGLWTWRSETIKGPCLSFWIEWFRTLRRQGSSDLLLPSCWRKRFVGPNKFEPLTKFFDSVLDGTADLKVTKLDAPGTTQEERMPLANGEDQVVLEPRNTPDAASESAQASASSETFVPAASETLSRSASQTGTVVKDTLTISPSSEPSSEGEQPQKVHPTDELWCIYCMFMLRCGGSTWWQRTHHRS